MNTEQSVEKSGFEVRTYFVRAHNALIARADFGELYVDYALHQAEHGYQYTAAQNTLLKETLTALVLHCASRPRNEVWAWTVHFREPMLNLFVTGDNRRGAVVGQLFTENVKDDGRNLFLADLARDRGDPRRSAVEFNGTDPFRIVEQFYEQSEQRPARYFRCGPEDFVMISAQPGCDIAWFAALNDEAVRQLDEREPLSLLEKRLYRWECGCTHERMLEVLAPVMRTDADALFEDEALLRMSCPRCGARYNVTREALEAFVGRQG